MKYISSGDTSIVIMGSLGTSDYLCKTIYVAFCHAVFLTNELKWHETFCSTWNSEQSSDLLHFSIFYPLFWFLCVLVYLTCITYNRFTAFFNINCTNVYILCQAIMWNAIKCLLQYLPCSCVWRFFKWNWCIAVLVELMYHNRVGL